MNDRDPVRCRVVACHSGTGWPGNGIVTRHTGTETVRVTANRRLFTARGTQKRTTNGTIVFCDRAGRTAAKALVISYTGRPRVAPAEKVVDREQSVLPELSG